MTAPIADEFTANYIASHAPPGAYTDKDIQDAVDYFIRKRRESSNFYTRGRSNRRDDPPENKVYVGNLPPGCNNEQLRHVFTRLRLQVIGIYINNEKCYANVTFSNPDDAAKAIVEANGYTFDDGCTIRVNVIRSKQNTYKTRGGEAADLDHTPSTGSGVGQRYNQNHVDADTDADSKFQEGFHSPSPPQQREHLPRNPNNLFGQLRIVGRSLGIPEHDLVRWLKEYTRQPEISDIADNPRHEDIKKGCDAMVQEISPGAVMFRNVCKHGLSPETVGPETFSELMKMTHGPQKGQVYAFESCSNLEEILHGLTFRRVGDIGQVTCFLKGMCFLNDGNVRHFNYPNFKTFKAKKFIPKPIDGRVLVWAAEVGQAIYTKTTKDFGGLSLEIFQENSSSNSYGGSCGYSNDNSRDDLLWMDKHIGLCVGAAMTEDRDAFYGRPYVTAPAKENLSRELEHAIRTNPDYQAACNKAMAEIGGIPVSLCSTFGHEEAERAAEDSDDGEEPKPGSWGAAAGH
jgi:hypothetical protein